MLYLNASIRGQFRRFSLAALLLVTVAETGSLTAQTNSIVSINADKVLVINGRKVFPIGFSPGPPTLGQTPEGKDALQELREAGALLFRIAQTTDWNSQLITNQIAALDWAGQHGMYIWLNLRELSKFSAGDSTTETALRNLVNTFKNHPALGLWKNFDEAWWADVSAADLQRGYDVIKQEDPNHPVVQTHAPRGTVADLQPYNVATDILALDIYPVGYPPGTHSLLPNKEISMIGDWADFLNQVGQGQKQYWMIEQIAWSGVVPTNKTLRFPTYEQERFMAYQAIIHGARGLMFFGGNVAATLNSRDALLGWNWTFWDDVLKRVVRQLGDNSPLGDALVVSNSTLPIIVSGATAPEFEFCVRETPPYLYILACKREGATVNVTFSGLPPSAVTGEALYEAPRSVKVVNGQFTDWFGPFEVRAYRFALSNQPPSILSQPQSRTNYPGTTATFTVSAGGTAPLSYQWRKDGLDLVDGGNVFGVTTTNLTLSNVSLSDMASYDVVVSGFGSVTSAPASLTVSTTAVVFYEPFDYANVGGPVSSNVPANWAYNGSGANDLNVTAGSLSYPDFAPSVGNSVTNGAAGLGVRRLTGMSVNSGTLYFSALFRINALGYGAWNGLTSQVGALTAPDNQSFRLAVMVKSNSPSGYAVGVQKGGTGATTTFSTTEYTAGETLLLLGKYDFNTAPNTVSLWINPSASTFGSPTEPPGSISASSGVDGFAIDRFNMRQNTAASVPAAMQWDELRIGNSWASVTPAPSPIAVTLDDVKKLPNGAFQFAYNNNSSLTFTVYSSTNLANWAALGEATQVSPGLYQFTDTSATNEPRRFYQLRSP